MKTTSTISVAFVTLAVGLVGHAVSPTPKPSHRLARPPAVRAVPESKTSPAEAAVGGNRSGHAAKRTARPQPSPATPAANQPPPNPILYLIGGALYRRRKELDSQALRRVE